MSRCPCTFDLRVQDEGGDVSTSMIKSLEVKIRKRTRDFYFPTTREEEVTRLDFVSTQL